MGENKTTESYSQCLKLMGLEDSKENRMVWTIAELSSRLDILERFVAKMHGYHEELDPTINSFSPTLKSFRAMREILTNMELPFM